MAKQVGKHRLQYLDWVRGLGALIMLQGHAFDSFLKNDLRGGAAYVYSQFVGGMPPAIFLFLTGVTLAFLMDSTERKGLAAGARVWTSLRRAGYLFAIAFAFRAQMVITGWPAPWSDLLKVDILNCMGFAIAVFAPMALFRTRERVRLCAILGAAIAFASPLISQINWTGVPQLARLYIAPDYHAFSFFPWAAYLAFGMSAGSIIRVMPPEATERAMQWAALAGGALLFACQYFSNLPYSIYTNAEFWLNSPAQVLSKLAVVLLMMAFAYLWTRYATADGWSWVRQFGTTSLLVYWVHIELVYGRWLAFWKGSLNVGQTIAAAVGLIVVMLALSAVRTNFGRVQAWFGGLLWGPAPRPDTASGD
jgi:uncharacterized membrane protein